jgi:hypothetical protein
MIDDLAIPHNDVEIQDDEEVNYFGPSYTVSL